MADIHKKLAENVAGEFFIDSTCINCINCSSMAPEFFREAGSYHVVYKQPETAEQVRRAMQVLVCCPVGAIGTVNRAALKEVMADFPLPVDDNVFYSGFNSPRTAGGASYFIKHPEGNWLICSPKFLPQLAARFEELGGIQYIFATHRDDVGDSGKYAAKFGSKRIIHKKDLDADPQAEIVIEGSDPVELAGDFLIIPQPGHTEGHCMLLYKNKFLFSGDALKPDPADHLIDTWDPLWTWYSFTEQANSVEKLQQYSFEWVLPSHGKPMRIAAVEAKTLLEGAVKRARELKNPELETPERLANLEMYAEDMRKWGQTLFAAKVDAQAEDLRAKLAIKRS